MHNIYISKWPTRPLYLFCMNLLSRYHCSTCLYVVSKWVNDLQCPVHSGTPWPPLPNRAKSDLNITISKGVGVKRKRHMMLLCNKFDLWAVPNYCVPNYRVVLLTVTVKLWAEETWQRNMLFYLFCFESIYQRFSFRKPRKSKQFFCESF